MNNPTVAQVLETRKAYALGARWGAGNNIRWMAAEERAAAMFPIPKVPRIVPFGGLLYRFVNGQIEYQDLGAWIPSVTYPAAALALFADLMANPEVDAG